VRAARLWRHRERGLTAAGRPARTRIGAKRLSSGALAAARPTGGRSFGPGVSQVEDEKSGPEASWASLQPPATTLSPEAARRRVIEILDADQSLQQYPDTHAARRPLLIAMARQAGDPALLVEALLFQLLAMVQVGRPEEAESSLTEARAIAQQTADAGSLGLCDLLGAAFGSISGDEVAAVAGMRAALPKMAFARNPQYKRLQGTILLALVFSDLGLVEESASAVAQALEMARDQSRPFLVARARYIALHSRLVGCLDRSEAFGRLATGDAEVASLIEHYRQLARDTEELRSTTANGVVEDFVQLLGLVGRDEEATELWHRRMDASALRWVSVVKVALISRNVESPERAIERIKLLTGPESDIPLSRQGSLFASLALACQRVGDHAAAVEALYSCMRCKDMASTRTAFQQAAVLNFDLETERNKLATQRALVHAGKLAAVGQLASSLAHEISQPSAALMLLSDEARGHLAAGRHAAALTCLQEVEQQTERLRRLVNRMKDFSRDDPMHIEKVSLDQVAEEAHGLLRSSLRDAGVACRVEVPALIVMTDKERVILSLVNLVNNAVDALRGQQSLPPEVRIVAQQQPETGEVSLSVLDNGPGLSDHTKTKVFQPFFTTKAAGQGLGLGLTITREALIGIGARLQVDNAEGGGARFTVCLPAPVRAREAALEPA
jgi:signal transduction histidine kinase